ncbi:MAG: class I SAM-dependent methyltransferase [Sphingobacteriales bacterium]|jgi:SAM-dependent methyltransferase|nr:MAG: class I SAM-dependent methyltransferase [Sphingobacteriales bacterium]
MTNFNNYSKYYDLLYKDKDYKTEVDYIIKKVDKFRPNSKNILELGCGSGSHAKYLCESNFSVFGIERSLEMVTLAKQKKIPNFNPNHGDITNFKSDQVFDVAISLFHVISYLTQNNDIIKCMKNVFNHLQSNGIFIFDVWYAPAVYNQKPETRVKRIENEEIKIIRIAESIHETENNLVEVNFEVNIIDKSTNITNTIFEKHPMRYYSIPEIKMISELIGFEVVLTEEYLTENKPSENTWGVCFILKKRQL